MSRNGQPTKSDTTEIEKREESGLNVGEEGACIDVS